jgi:hypothetical protein
VFRRLILIITFLALTFAFAEAQGSWSIFLYNAQDGSITQVRANGEVAGSFMLPLSQGFNTYSAFADVSLSGRFIAYTAFDSTQERPNRQLFVFDRNLSATRFTYDITNAVLEEGETNPIPVVFDEVNQQVAFSVLTEVEGWQMIVGDLALSAPLATLTAEGSDGLSADVLPRIQRYDGTHVWFTQEDTGLRWNIGTGDVEEDDTFAASILDFDPFSGQTAVVEDNATQIVSATGERATLYEETEGEIRGVSFIQLGTRLLVEVENGDERTLRVLNRDGTVAGELIGTLESITGTPDGLIGLFESNGAPALAHVITTQDALTPQTLWTGNQGTTPLLLGIILDADFVAPPPPTLQD